MAKIAKLTGAQRRLQRLLAAGFFPAELPPSFTTRDFALGAIKYAGKWPSAEISKFWTAPEHYSVPRYGQARRKTSIVNPVNQLLTSKIIADDWPSIRQRLRRSKITEFSPEIKFTGGRAVTGVDFDGVNRKQAQILGSHGRYVKTDVARFYPSIYTHSIAWAVHGKEWVKANKNTDQFKTSYANALDKAVGAGQRGQTTGIPIGPDTSRIISELIATEVEEEMRRGLADLDVRAVRYVDDLIIGLSMEETSAVVLAKVSAALYDYELELSAEKTSLHGVGCPHHPEWTHYIRGFDVSTDVNRQRDDIDSFFNHIFYLSDQNERENVILFAVKRATSFQLDTSNWEHLVRWLLYSVRRSTVCLSYVAEFLATAVASGQAVDLAEVGRLIHQLLPAVAAAAQTHEIVWLLFLARELGIAVQEESLVMVSRVKSGAVALAALDLRQRSLIVGDIDTKLWKQYAKADGLKSEMWLAAYEITQKGWWKRPTSLGYIQNNKFFSDLLADGVEFYDPSRRARRNARSVFYTRLGLTAFGPYP